MGSRATDEELLQAWKAGDRRAGAALFVRHQAEISRFFKLRFGPDVDDLVQNTFVGLIEGLPRFRGECSPRTLLFAIAHKQMCHRFRQLRREKKFEPNEQSVADLATSPSGVIAAKQEQRLLLAAMRRLPINTQIILELYYWEGFKTREIAEILNCNHDSVRTRKRRGRQQLRILIEQLANDPAQIEESLSSLSRRVTEVVGDTEESNSLGRPEEIRT